MLTGGEICNATLLFLSLRVRHWRTHLPRQEEALAPKHQLLAPKGNTTQRADNVLSPTTIKMGK